MTQHGPIYEMLIKEKEHLVELKQKNMEIDGYNPTLLNGALQIITLILPKVLELESVWIPIEHIPNESMEVLVHSSFLDYTYACYFNSKHGKFYDDDGFESKGISHYMKIPSPPTK